MCCTLPLMIIGLINWLKHQDDTNTVVIKDITKKELIIVLLSQAVLFGGYYYLLTGYAGDVQTVTAYNMLGEVQYIKKYYVNNKSQASDLKEEPEGLKIYNNSIFVGHTNSYNGGSLFNIGVFKWKMI